MKSIFTGYTWVLFLPAVLPLFYIEGTMYPLLAPKVLALRAFGIIALALFTYLACTKQPFFWHRLRRRETWIPAGLLALAYLASLLGTDFYRSFWSTFERGDGLLTLTVCIGYFYLLLLSAESSWMPRFFKIVAWTGSLAAVYLVLQWLVSIHVVDLSFIVKANGRIGGTMGNAAFLAAYLGMTFFATLPVLQEYRGWWKKLLYSGAGLQLFAILLTATRGTLLALFCVGIVTVLYLAFMKEGRVQMYARGALAMLIIFVGLFFTFKTQLAQIPFEPLQRIASISFSDPTVSSRLFIWRTVSKEAQSHALLGYGAEQISVPFDRVYDPSLMTEEWFDRSHNAYLDYFVQFGIGGLLFYLALIVLIVHTGWKLWKKGSHYGPALIGIVSVYALQNFFVFDTAMTLWLLLACAALALANRYAEERETPFYTKYLQSFPGAFLGVLLLFFLYPVFLQPLRANLLAFEAYQYQVVDVARANAASREGLSLGTYADLEFGYNAYFIYTDEQRHRFKGEDLRLAYQNAVTLLSYTFDRYPYDARTAVYLAQIINLAPEGIAADQSLLASALERSIRLSPKRYQPWYILANLSISNANLYPAKSPERIAGYAAAQDILMRYNSLVPALSAPHFVLAQLLYASGNTAEAALEAEKGNAQYVSDLETAHRAARYYESVLDLPHAAFYLEEILRLDPANADAASDLDKIKAYLSR